MTKLNVSDLSILLVEPSVVQRKIILSMLADSGVREIEGVSNTEDALARLEHFLPDLVISNMYLDSMTGADLVLKLRESPKMADVPFMLISSETRFKALDPVRQAGVVAILPKPFDTASLKRALSSTIEFIESDELELEHYDIAEIRVLLVDDSLTARKHVARVLTNIGIRHITMANNGRQACEVIDNANFDLIITDFNMPEMDGEALIQHVRNNTHLSHVPIMMITSDSKNPRMANVQQKGVSAICDKPFDTSHVKNSIMRLLSD